MIRAEKPARREEPAQARTASPCDERRGHAPRLGVRVVEVVEAVDAARLGRLEGAFDHARDVEERERLREEGVHRDLVGRVQHAGSGAARPTAASRASARQRKVSGSGGSKVSSPTVARSSVPHRDVGALGIVQRVGDRHAHVGVPEVGERGAVVEVDQRVHDRLRVHDYADALVGTPNRWCASITSRPLFIRVAESIVILPPISQVGCASASRTSTLRERRPSSRGRGRRRR